MHKKEYQKHFENLDKETKLIISLDPKSEEAIGLDVIVDMEIWKLLNN